MYCLWIQLFHISTINNMKLLLIFALINSNKEVVTEKPTVKVEQSAPNLTNFNEGEWIKWKKYIQDK